MEKVIVFITLGLISLVAVSGCLSGGPVECGSDESCFSEAVSECTPANVRTEVKQTSFGAIDVRYVISGSTEGVITQGDSCVVRYTFEEVEMVGNLTEAPSRLLFHLISLGGAPIDCLSQGEVSLDINGLNDSESICSGIGMDTLRLALMYKDGEPPAPPSTLDIRESYCIGGDRIVVNVRNHGLTDINISSDLELINAESGEHMAVEWKDFSGLQKIDMLYPLKIAQFEIMDLQPGNHSYNIKLWNISYPFSAQC